VIWLFIGLVGGIIVFSFYTGTTWKLTTFVIEVPSKFGYLSVSDSDISYYDKVVQEATNKFLETGNLQTDDNSGLSYYDRSGVFHQGALTNAEKTSVRFILPAFILAFSILNFFLIKRAYRKIYK